MVLEVGPGLARRCRDTVLPAARLQDGMRLRKLLLVHRVWTRLLAVCCSPEASRPRREGAGGRWGASWPCWQVLGGSAICACPLAPSQVLPKREELGSQQGHCVAGWSCTLHVF